VPFLPPPRSDQTLLPIDYDYPLYSAYPAKTVVDILGPRTQRTPPAIDRPAAEVDLNDVQGNILSGYRASEAIHLFLTIDNALSARNWLATALDRPDPKKPWGGLMTATRWPADPAARPDVLTNVGFTFAGLQKLLPERYAAGHLKHFPLAFQQGAFARAKQNRDVGPHAPQQWLFGLDDQHIDVVISVYSKPKPSPAVAIKGRVKPFLNASNKLLAKASKNGMKLIHGQKTQALGADGREHFGFIDGIAKPRISGVCKPDDADFQPAASPGEFLLGPYSSIFGGQSLGDMPADLANNGTFGALRLLEQDVAGFNKTVNDEADRLSGVLGRTITPELIKAKLLGRWQVDGTPLAVNPTAPSKQTPPSNEFDYAPSWEYPTSPSTREDHAGMQCPAGAHIRRTNPRSARVAGYPHSRRLIRRGMPTAWTETDGSTHQGLLGLFIGASLERQFEFIQQQWMHGDLAASGIRGEQDPIAGQRDGGQPYNIPGIGTVTLPPFVRTRGSLYIFFPSSRMLHALKTPRLDAVLASARAEAHPVDAGADSADDVSAETPDAAIARDLDAMAQKWPDLAELLRLATDHGWLTSTWAQQLWKLFQRLSVKATAPIPDPATPIARFDPLDPAFIANPFDTFAHLRALGSPVWWVPAQQAHWVVTASAARTVLNDPTTFKQQLADLPPRGILTSDGNLHILLRDAVGAAFTAQMKRVGGMVTTAARDALRGIGNLPRFDAVPLYSKKVARQVFWELFCHAGAGLDTVACDAHAHTIMLNFSQPEGRGASSQIASADASLKLARQLGLALAKALLESYSQPNAQPRTILRELAARTKSPFPDCGSTRTLSLKETLVTLLQLVLAGMSTHFLLGSALKNLLSPDPRPVLNALIPWHALAALQRAHPQDLPAALDLALDEARRIDPPVTIIQRYAATQTRIGGVVIPAGSSVFVVAASANRDAAPGDTPEWFLWNRTTPLTQMSFGHGIHECIGKALQQAIVPAALTELLTAMPELRLDRPGAEPAWIDNVYFRDLMSLPVTRCC
ncbi:MAG: cytochrome P450, partial [Microbacteriaceae bacterium]|nr:cytochrome P450 [Burkholderiaceae bacterium]